MLAIHLPENSETLQGKDERHEVINTEPRVIPGAFGSSVDDKANVVSSDAVSKMSAHNKIDRHIENSICNNSSVKAPSTNSCDSNVNEDLQRENVGFKDGDDAESDGEFPDLGPASMNRAESSLPQCPCLTDDAQGELTKDIITHVQAGVPQHLLWLVGVVMRQDKTINELSSQLQQSIQQVTELKKFIDASFSPYPSSASSCSSASSSSHLNSINSFSPGSEAPYRRGFRLPVSAKMGRPAPDVIQMRIPGRQGLTYTRRWLLANRSPIVADSAARDLHVNVNLYPGAFTTEPVLTDKNGYVFPSSASFSSSPATSSSSSPATSSSSNAMPRRFGEDRWAHDAFERAETRTFYPRVVFQREPRVGKQEARKPKEIERSQSATAWKPPPREGLSEEEVLGRQLLVQLNKLTLEKFDAISNNIIDILKQVTSVPLMQKASEVIFEKAIAERHFAPIYGKLCQTIRKSPELKEVVKAHNRELGFAFQLLGRCQKEFESSRSKLTDVSSPANEEPGGTEELRRKRFLGMAIFFGELYKDEIIKDVILRGCINGLLKELNGSNEESIEGLVQLLETAGARLELDEKNQVPLWFGAIKEAAANQKSSARLRFLLQNLVELRARGWKPRGPQEEVKALEEVSRNHARPQHHSRDQRSDRDGPAVVSLKNHNRTDLKVRRKPT